MTKLQALDKINKLLNVANGKGNEHEKATARKQAEALIKKYNVSTDEMKLSPKAQAFDKLVDVLQQYTSKNPNMKDGMFDHYRVIGDILGKSKDIKPLEKADYLDKIVGGVRIGVFLFGTGNKTLADIKTIIDDVLRSYNITV